MDYAARDRNPTLPRSRARRRIHFSAMGVSRPSAKLMDDNVHYRLSKEACEEAGGLRKVNAPGSKKVCGKQGFDLSARINTLREGQEAYP